MHTDEAMPIKLAAFIAEQRITMHAEPIDRNPNMTDDDWSKTATHWRVVLTRAAQSGRGYWPKRQLTTYFSQGQAHTEPPTTEDVLNCLILDAASIEASGGFEDWASDLGFDTDSRKAERSYKCTKRAATNLERFLGRDAYEVALWKTETL